MRERLTRATRSRTICRRRRQRNARVIHLACILSFARTCSRRFARVNTGSEHCYSLYDSLKTISAALPVHRARVARSPVYNSPKYRRAEIPGFCFVGVLLHGGANLLERGLSAPKHRFFMKCLEFRSQKIRAIKKKLPSCQRFTWKTIFSNSLSKKSSAERIRRRAFLDLSFSFRRTPRVLDLD